MTSKVENCSECQYSCRWKSELRIHVDRVHKKLKPFKCDICEKSFARKTLFKRHENIHETKTI